MARQYVGLVDCNNFFVSCERLFRPDLARRPVLVLSSNDGCVISRSQEVKDRGIPMGVPYYQIKDKIMEERIAVFSSNFTLYRDLSQRVFSIIKKEVDRFEPYSIDEGFFTVSLSEAERLGEHLKDKVSRAVGIPVSIGMAPSKTIAKLATSVAKKTSGVTVWSLPMWEEQAPQVLVGELWGVGRQRTKALQAAQLLTAADIMHADTAFLKRRFGIEGLRLQAELRGESAYPLVTVATVQKSIMSSRSFAKKTRSESVVQDAVAHHLRSVVSDLCKQGLVAGALSIFIRSSRHEVVAAGRGSKEMVLLVPTDNLAILLTHAAVAVATMFDANVAYEKAGVLLSRLSLKAIQSPSLFLTDTKEQAWEGALSVVHGLETRYGRPVVELGRHHQTALWQSRRSWLSPAYTTRWCELKKVRAR